MSRILDLAKAIKLLILDVDGVMTDGKLHIDDKGVETKTFNSQDGIGIKILQNSGVEVAVITARQSNLVAKRMASLGIQYVYQNQEDKFSIYQMLMEKFSLSKSQIAMVGDDLPDLKIVHDCGLGIAVANAQAIIKEHADYVTLNSGDNGAVREICNLIMRAQNTLQAAHDAYLN
ncbi:MAG: HAD-IIIA family hydrolase [Pseudomonadota bacterium]